MVSVVSQCVRGVPRDWQANPICDTCEEGVYVQKGVAFVVLVWKGYVQQVVTLVVLVRRFFG
mgnify:CR=1 FL=1